MKFFKNHIKYTLILLLTLFVFASIEAPNTYGKTKKKTTAKVSKSKIKTKPKQKSKSISKSKTKKKTSKKRRTTLNKVRVPLLKEESTIEITSVDTLAPGVLYKKLLIGDAKLKYFVHCVEADLSDPQNDIAVLKAKHQISEVEKLQTMNHYYDSTNSDKQLLASINANFWRAYSNFPIGPVVVRGEIVEMNSYKNWSSAFFDSRNRMYIDRFRINGTIRSKKGLFLNIDAVNRRLDSTQVVVYNQYGGDSIPYIPQKSMSKALDFALQEIEMKDSTDIELDTLELRKQIQSARRMETLEYSMPKLTLKYLTPPAINKNINCIVVSLDSFAVNTTPRTCILSFGRQFPSYDLPAIGDTLVLRYETNVMSNTIFTEAVSGTPRLIRNGKVGHEAEIEGSRARRFISYPLPRTAIGTDETKNKAWLVVVEPSNSSKQTVGASLSELAKIMKMIGAYNAMNLDGGGSSILAIDEQNQLFPNNPDICRRLSVGLAFIRKEKKKYMRAIQKQLIESKITE